MDRLERCVIHGVDEHQKLDIPLAQIMRGLRKQQAVFGNWMSDYPVERKKCCLMPFQGQLMEMTCTYPAIGFCHAQQNTHLDFN